MQTSVVFRTQRAGARNRPGDRGSPTQEGDSSGPHGLRSAFEHQDTHSGVHEDRGKDTQMYLCNE